MKISTLPAAVAEYAVVAVVKIRSPPAAAVVPASVAVVMTQSRLAAVVGLAVLKIPSMIAAAGSGFAADVAVAIAVARTSSWYAVAMLNSGP